ncbi:MAG TPA: hypothetical protein VM285_10185, partial [Polyangia bacterium]|nr:hypothetical protein [Polyangia bacterium]
SARRLARQLHAPESAGLLALHITVFGAPAQVPEKTTFVNVVTPDPEAVGLAESFVASEVSLAPALGPTQVPPRTRAADVGAAVGGGADV